jgi:hypothetical protein
MNMSDHRGCGHLISIHVWRIWRWRQGPPRLCIEWWTRLPYTSSLVARGSLKVFFKLHFTAITSIPIVHASHHQAPELVTRAESRYGYGISTQRTAQCHSHLFVQEQARVAPKHVAIPFLALQTSLLDVVVLVSPSWSVSSPWLLCRIILRVF